MKTIIISDTHLSGRFEPKTFDYLNALFNKADKIIINGDFWDGYLCSFDDFTSSPWNQLFPILKAKNTLYLYGNHDKPEWLDNKINWFSTHQQNEHTIPQKNQELVIQHGNIVHPGFNKICPKPVHKIGLNCRTLVNRFLGPSFYKYFPPTKKYQNDLKHWASTHLKNNQVFVCGHSHTAEIDLPNRFVNCGFVGQGYGQYVVVENNSVDLIQERY